MRDKELKQVSELARSEQIARLFDFDSFGWQTDVLDSDAPAKVLRVGRQCGKTETCGAISAHSALSGRDVLVSARFQKAADIGFQRAISHLQELDALSKNLGVERDNLRMWELANGAKIQARPLPQEASQVRGMNPSVIIVDEAALVADRVFTDVLRPMLLTHGLDSEFVILSTPQDRSGYFYRACQPGSAFKQWHETTPEWVESVLESGRHDILDSSAREWLADERESIDSVSWEREYEARFASTESSYLPDDLVRSCVVDPAPGLSEHVTLAVDPARHGDDDSSYVACDNRGTIEVLAQIPKETAPDTTNRIRELNDRYNFSAILIDSNSYGSAITDFAKLGTDRVHGFPFSSQNKQKLYQHLRMRLESGDVALPDHSALVSQLTSLESDFTTTGILRLEPPTGMHDDLADACALSVFGSCRSGRWVGASESDATGVVESGRSERAKPTFAKRSRSDSRGVDRASVQQQVDSWMDRRLN